MKELEINQFHQILLLIIYTAIKSFLIYSCYNIGTDLCLQMNVSENLFNGNGLVLSSGDGYSTDQLYLTHPPMVSLCLAVIRHFTTSIITADLTLRFLLVFCEAILFFYFLQNFTERKSIFIFIFIGMAFYAGHLDRGFTGDQFGFIVAFFLIYQTFHFGKSKSKTNFFWVSISVLLLPLTKYTLLPLSVLPFCYLFFLKNYYAEDVKVKTLYFLFLTFVGALIIFLLETSQLSNAAIHSLSFSNIKYLYRIDYFWMHGGLDLDRIYKHLMWNIDRYTNLKVSFVNIGQMLSISMILMLFWSDRFWIVKKRLFYFFLIIIFLQVSYLILLTLLTDPQIGNYGIDGKIWVPLEEARYYNYLTFFSFLSIVLLLTKKRVVVMSFLFLFIAGAGVYSCRVLGRYENLNDKFLQYKGESVHPKDESMAIKFDIIFPQ
jgi:hypothetical protein